MNPKDCYQVAGEETYQSPQSELEERCQIALAAIEEVAAVKSIAPQEVQVMLLGIIDVIQDHVDTLQRYIEE